MIFIVLFSGVEGHICYEGSYNVASDAVRAARCIHEIGRRVEIHTVPAMADWHLERSKLMDPYLPLPNE